jgi:hypothetical protein
MTPTRHLGSALALAAVLALVGCGDQTAGSVAPSTDVGAAASGTGSDSDVGGASGTSDSSRGGGSAGPGENDADAPIEKSVVVRLAPGDVKPELVCPTDDRSMMIADFAQGAEGAARPEDAVGSGLVQSGEQLVLSASGATAWVLRLDGTARMEIGLLHDGGWLLHQRTSCG